MIGKLETNRGCALFVCRRFAGLVAQGKSPTEELLADWGTSNCTVGELVDILKSHKLLAAAAILLPGMIQITTAMQIAFNCSEYTSFLGDTNIFLI